MNYIVTVIVFVLIFSLLILIHELGHFVMAKRAGIKVEEFGFGLPPRAWGKKVGETIYSINWIPFGGFVRMLGEDSLDSKMLKSKRSFAGKPMRARVKVVVAGVVMNFLLAWILLAVGFTAGMQPLLAPGDVLPAVDSGIIELAEGLKLKEVSEESLFYDVGVRPDDVIFSIDGKMVDSFAISEMMEDPSGIYKVNREGAILSYEILEGQVEGYVAEVDFGVEFYDFVPFPRVKIFDLDDSSEAYRMGLRAGDVIISVNGNNVFSVEGFEGVSRGEDVLEYEIYRNGFREKFIVELGQVRKVVVSEVSHGFPAYNAGLREGDVIVSVNGNLIDDSAEFISFLSEHSEEKLAYVIERQGESVFYEIQAEEGVIGVLISELMIYGAEQEMSVYNVDVVSSVLKINEQQYVWYISIYKSFGEGVRLAKLTGEMFVGFVSSLLNGDGVPASVAGPVGIAQLTHVFVQEGFISVLRFVAILSLSLAVINILPFPALDGGRLLFILIEFITGRRVNQKWESLIHAFGYVLILLLILAVTYSDIMRLIGV